MKDWLELLKTCEREKRGIVLLSFLQCASQISTVVLAFAMKHVIDSAVDKDTDSFFIWIGCFVCLCLLIALLKGTVKYLDEVLRAKLQKKLRSEMFQHLMHLPYSLTQKNHSGEWMNLLTSDVNYVVDGMVSCFVGATAAVVKAFGVLIGLWLISKWTALLFLGAGLIVLVCSLVPRKYVKSMQKSVLESEGKSRSFMQECIQNIMVIFSFDKHKEMDQSADVLMEQVVELKKKKAWISSWASSLLYAGIHIAYAAGLAIGGWGLIHSTLSYGSLSAMIQLISMVQTPFVQMSGLLPRFHSASASAERLCALLKQKKMEHLKEMDESFDKLVFEDVTFRYDEENVLEHESFEIQNGQFVGVSGKSGAGKTTMFKILLGLIYPDSGKAYLRCSDGKEIAFHQLKGFMAYVPQGHGLMSGTIEEIVSFYELNPDEKRVKWACEMACASDFIEQMPNQYKTILKERGTGLSEGQMQRLAIARALYSGKEILLLDECTSALDEATEHQVMMNLRSMKKTVLLISHRKSVLEACDSILRKGDES